MEQINIIVFCVFVVKKTKLIIYNIAINEKWLFSPCFCISKICG